MIPERASVRHRPLRVFAASRTACGRMDVLERTKGKEAP